MKFVISRTSMWNNNEKPCDEAIEETCYFNDLNGNTFKRKRWIIQINSLDELLKFKEKYESELVITTTYYDGSYEIEIYDDYRE